MPSKYIPVPAEQNKVTQRRKPIDVRMEDGTVKRFASIYEASKQLGINRNTIRSLLRNGSRKYTYAGQPFKKESQSGNSVKHHRLYGVWNNMISRCYREYTPVFKYYGAKGIGVCDEWKQFDSFLKWALDNGYDEDAPRGTYTIDRIDPTKDYSPSNCRWITAAGQLKNREGYFVSSYIIRGKCEVCGEDVKSTFMFCPTCGAKLFGGVAEK